MLKEKAETLGEASLRLAKSPDSQQNCIDTQREMQKGYFDELVKCAKRGEVLHGNQSPFYVCVQTRRERLLQNVIRSQFYTRVTRPIPQYDMALYHYDPTSEALSFVWCIPDKETVDYFAGYWKPQDRGPPVWIDGAIPYEEERQLASFCVSFRANSLV